MNKSSLKSFIENLPKAELHIHLEGTLEPDMFLYLAKRNHIAIEYTSVDALRDAYNEVHNLQDFLTLYGDCTKVLQTEEDFYDLTLAYLMQMYDEHVVRIELMWNPQLHLQRGVALSCQIHGIHRAITYARNEYGMSVGLILNFLRNLSEDDALRVLEECMPYAHLILAVGLDSMEVGYPPSIFRRLFKKAKQAGFRLVAHAGEEGPVEYIAEALDVLHVERIDHGITCWKDPTVMTKLVKHRIPLTTCPLSSVKLTIIADIGAFPLRSMMNAHLLITINSDDPAYFGGYLSQNYLAVAESFHLTRDELRLLAKNSFEASFASDQEKTKWIAMVDEYCDSWNDENQSSSM